MSDQCQGCEEYRALSRRRFLAETGSAAGAAAVLASAPAWLPRVALARDYRGAQRDVVVCIFLRGASDGLTMVAPFNDPNYIAARPTIAIPPPGSGGNSAIQLPNASAGNTEFGFAPSMGSLLPAYLDGKLLLIHAAGSTDPSRSHFDAQRFMEVGLPNDPTLGTGWLGRHLYSVAPSAPNALLRAVGISTGLQRSLVGAPQSLPIPNLDQFGLVGTTATIAEREAALGDMYAGVPDPLRAAAETTIDTITLLNTINFDGYQPAGGATYSTDSLGVAMKSTAALIKAQVGVEAVAIDVNGWDTHNNQGVFTGTMASLMASLAGAMGAFYTDMFSGVAPSVTVVAMSEFGRRLVQNGSGGSDHGHGNVMLVMGTCVDGGRLMVNWPGLAPGQLYQGLDLDVTIDYRDILAEIVAQRLGNPNLGYVFPQFTPTPRGVFAC